MLKHLVAGIIMVSAGCSHEPSPPLTPEGELATFQIAPGYAIELVASEPMVQDPVVIKFDEDGRLWVVEMRGFMPDIDGNGEEMPVGRVSILMDMNHDGKMDSATVFVDSLVLPRALAIVKRGALVAEDEALWFMEDLDGDLKADKKTIIDAEYGNKGVVEHSPNGLWRGMDNWYYNAKSNIRYRLEHGNWIKEETEFRGQWGMSHDNTGRLYYNYNWSQLHMDLVPPNYLSRNPNHQPTSGIDYSLSQDRRVFPIRTNLAINRGYIDGALSEKGSLMEFTSACAPFVYRGNLFETEVVGDVFVCEPTGNLIKRNIVEENGLFPTAKNAYPEKEFLAATDERFRPVWLSSGPDGALYVADMYRGIIQHGLYMSTYLRDVTLDRKLERPVNMGRIWRIFPETNAKSEPLKLSEASIDELIEFLGHKNGWYRDMAQRLLVEKRDLKAIQKLQQLIHKDPNYLARLHGLWSLEGMGIEDPVIYLTALQDLNENVQVASLRILEKIAAKNPDVLIQLGHTMGKMNFNEVTGLQLALTAGVINSPEKHGLLSRILTNYIDSPIFRDAVMSSIPDQEYEFLRMVLGRSEWHYYSGNREKIMLEMLAESIAKKGNPKELEELLELVNIDSLGWEHRAIIAGLSIHGHTDSTKIPLAVEPGIFSKVIDEDQLSSQLSRISALFTWPGKPVNLDTITAINTDFLDPEVFAHGRGIYLTICSSCHGNDGKGLPRFAPPLVRSEWVLGDPRRLTLILLHGMEGPIEVNGKKYDSPDILPEMPSFASTSADDLAAVLTYIRREWEHNASPIDAGAVGGIRIRSQGKVTPWTSDELLNMEDD